jgi:diguanylate cyclase (GGDEF)-like protein/putative nucleotidyltransferase with HDIG domain
MGTARPATDRTVSAPRLLLLVFGIFLVLVGITGSALVAVTSTHLTGSTFDVVLERDRSLVDLFANGNLTVADLGTPGPDAARRAELGERLAALARTDGIVAIDVRDRAGSVVAAGGTLAGDLVPARLSAALDGRPGAELGDDALLGEYLPLVAEDGRVLGAVVLQRDAAPVLAAVGDAGRDVLLVTLLAAAVLAGILVLVFRAAHHRLIRQQAQLADAARRDALTGMLNHGSVVSLLAERIERARADAEPVAVALVDIDNFRLFNDTHGHEAGDAVLLQVAGLVSAMAGVDGLAARYGPDEFLVVRAGEEASALEGIGEGLRSGLEALSIRVGDSEELPVTVSIGIAATPVHASSVTPLLSEASIALGEARASGGDRVLVGRVGEERGLHAGGFDVLQGLVLAVDTKDRYTKRHSEDVARYGVYLARRLGEDDLLEPVRLAGLLHDVGKIGIPDRLLRKPGRLTEAEVKVFNQHVSLGDAIVRDLPEVDLVRAGIRHHHERWDGGGYLAGLAGDEIPLIARIIAVADTFSAMTTTRPYRKALSVEEALRRLREAAGTQLQPELVEAFASGIETDPAAPGPNEPSDVWQPLRVA